MASPSHGRAPRRCRREPRVPVPGRPDGQRQERGGDGDGASVADRDRQRRLGAGLSRHGHRHRQAERCRARRGAAPPDRHRRSARALFGGALRRRCDATDRARSAHAAACRCWSAARCCTSRRCSTGSMRCPRPTPRCARRSTRWPPSAAGRQCMPSWRRSIRPTRRALAAERCSSASSARSRCAASPAGRCRSCSAARARQRHAAPLLALEPSIAQLAARAHRRALPRHARRRSGRRSARAARARRPARRRCRRCAASATGRCGRRWTTGRSRPLVATRGVAATRQLAKRQLTWLRGMPEREVRGVRCAATRSRAASNGRCAPPSAWTAERGAARSRRPRQALRRCTGFHRRIARPSKPAKWSPCSVNPASASRRC